MAEPRQTARVEETRETMEGIVRRVIFHNSENGFTVLEVKVRSADGGGRVTVVGPMPELQEGESASFTGRWRENPKYGRQFEVEAVQPLLPTTLEGIEKYLGSGIIKGIGPKLARKLVEHFGLRTLELAADPTQVRQVEGVGPRKAERIARALAEHREIQEMMVALQGLGISPAYAARIYRRYQTDAYRVVTEEPYRLADEVPGIGFLIADGIAQKVGIASNAPARIRAGIRYALEQQTEAGHVYYPRGLLLAAAAELLGVEPGLVEAELAALIRERKVIVETLGEASEEAIYSPPFYYAERFIAQALLRSGGDLLFHPGELDEDLAELEKETGLVLAHQQREAVVRAMTAGVMVLTGGPGTGKTTTVRAIITLLRKRGFKFLLAAPTGRAAKRLAEATGFPAKTIHRLLEFAPGTEEGAGMHFLRNKERPLRADVVIIDEVSMVDTLLMYHLLQALPPEARLILVGDKDQLPSVGPGNVLRDIIASGAVEVVALTQIFRQAARSLIVVNAHRINQGLMPFLRSGRPEREEESGASQAHGPQTAGSGRHHRQEQDFFFISQQEPEEIAATVVDLVQRRLPSYAHCHPLDEIQVLTPMRRGVIGVEALNRRLQAALNPPRAGEEGLPAGGGVVFYLRDKVMQVKNNYEKLVFNGDIGRVVVLDPEERRLVVEFPEEEGTRRVSYEQAELGELVLAYAITVHKSQGSEYPVVVMPLSTQHYILLQRNLLYTALTRAKRLAVLVGTKQALWLAIKNNKTEERFTRLAARLQEYRRLEAAAHKLMEG